MVFDSFCGGDLEMGDGAWIFSLDIRVFVAAAEVGCAAANFAAK